MIPRLRFPHALLVVTLACAAPLLGQVTESPHTIAPGKVRLEVDGVKLSYDRADAAGNKHTALGVASTVLNAGLTSSVDLQVRADFFIKHTFEFRGTRETHSGRGDLYFRTKWTFWRNDTIGAAMAVIPYVKLPSNTGGIGNNAVEGGFILPWGMQLAPGFSAGAQFQWDHVRNPDLNGYDAHWYLSGFVQQNFTSAFAIYAETTTRFSSAGFSEWVGTLGAGALLHVTQHVQLDYEIQRGLNARATDWTHVFRVNWDW
jgi:hypothetical protein